MQGNEAFLHGALAHGGAISWFAARLTLDRDARCLFITYGGDAKEGSGADLASPKTLVMDLRALESCSVDGSATLSLQDAKGAGAEPAMEEPTVLRLGFKRQLLPLFGLTAATETLLAHSRATALRWRAALLHAGLGQNAFAGFTARARGRGEVEHSAEEEAAEGVGQQQRLRWARGVLGHDSDSAHSAAWAEDGAAAAGGAAAEALLVHYTGEAAHDGSEERGGGGVTTATTPLLDKPAFAALYVDAALALGAAGDDSVLAGVEVRAEGGAVVGGGAVAAFAAAATAVFSGGGSSSSSSSGGGGSGGGPLGALRFVAGLEARWAECTALRADAAAPYTHAHAPTSVSAAAAAAALRQPAASGTGRPRIFAGTWNVAGEGPHPCVDYRAWVAQGGQHDMAVCGLQEVVPLSATHVVLSDELARARVRAWAAALLAALDAADADAERSAVSGGFEGGAAHGRGARRRRGSWVLVAADYLVGVALLVFARRSVKGDVRQVRCGRLATGFGGLLGNKGAVGCSLQLLHGKAVEQAGDGEQQQQQQQEQQHVEEEEEEEKKKRTAVVTTVAFVCAHLSAHEGAKNATKRHRDFCDIVQPRSRLIFDRPCDADGFATAASPAQTTAASVEGKKLLEHDAVLFLGDLNHRLRQEEGSGGLTAREALAAAAALKEPAARATALTAVLRRSDELTTLLEAASTSPGGSSGGISDDGVYDAWREAVVPPFPPTYKFARMKGAPLLPPRALTDAGGQDVYDQKRCAAWTDRILFFGAIAPLPHAYTSVPSMRLSDHRPVSCVFELSPQT